MRTYSWVAREAGHPLAVRATGSALARNPIPFHPVPPGVRSDRRLGEYSGGGPGAKRAVLAREGLDPSLLEELSRSRVRYLGNGAERFFCVPTCGGLQAPRSRGHPLPLSRGGARRGLPACATCRPVWLAQAA